MYKRNLIRDFSDVYLQNFSNNDKFFYDKFNYVIFQLFAPSFSIITRKADK